jgi:hypothetical protein
MGTKQRAVTLPTVETIEHQGTEATGHVESSAGGVREDGSGGTTLKDRSTLAGSGETPDRQLDVRDR